MWHWTSVDQTSLCSLLLSLETQNDIQSVAFKQNIQATSKGSGQTAHTCMLRLIRGFASHIPHCWKFHVAAQLLYTNN